jgi:hypothetical protein
MTDQSASVGPIQVLGIEVIGGLESGMELAALRSYLPLAKGGHISLEIVTYDSGEHRPLATRSGVDAGVLNFAFRSRILCLLGYPEATLENDAAALTTARKNQSSRHADVRADGHIANPYLLRELFVQRHNILRWSKGMPSHPVRRKR